MNSGRRISPASLLLLLGCIAFPEVSIRGRLAAQETVPKKAGEWQEQSMRVGTLDRWFRIYRPQSLRERAPAVVLLHGGTQSMRKIFAPRAGGTRAWIDIADREGVLLIVPNGVNPKTGDTRGDNQNWNDLRSQDSDRNSTADDVAFLRQLRNEMVSNDRLDDTRIYVTGASNGGMMTYRLLLEAPECFAAAATFIAVLPAGMQETPPPRRPTPLLIANGTLDPLIPWKGGPVRGQSEPLMSAPANLDWWIRANRADRDRVTEERLADTSPDDGCRLIQSLYPAGTGGAPVLFLKMEGAGHALPSRAHAVPDTWMVRRLIGPLCQDAEGAELAWSFLSQFPSPIVRKPAPSEQPPAGSLR